MKKVIVLIGSLIVLITSIVIGILYIYGVFDIFDDTIDGEFDITNCYYTDWWRTIKEKEDTMEFIVLESADSPAVLRKEAQKIWIEKYGLKIRFEQKPYIVFYDPVNEIWLLTGTLPGVGEDDGVANMGGTAKMIIEKQTGKVLMIWHDK